MKKAKSDKKPVNGQNHNRGVKTRGNGAATKGTTARGPMA